MLFGTRALYFSPSRDVTSALATLGISASDASDKKALKKRYLELVKKHHPDTGGDAEKMKNISTAYELLRNLSPSQLRSDRREKSTTRQYPAYSQQPQHPNIFNERQMPEAWVEFERMRRNARENPFMSGFPAHSTSEFMRQQQEQMYRQFSFRHAFQRSMFAYFVMTLIAFSFMRLLERLEVQEPSQNHHIGRLNEVHDTFKRRIEVIENKRRTKDQDKNNFFVLREAPNEEKSSRRGVHVSTRQDKSHVATKNVQKVPSSIRGVNYYYPVHNG